MQFKRLPRRKGTAGEKPGADERQRLKGVELLLDVSPKMAAFDTLDEVLNSLVETTTAELDAERGSLFLDDPDTNELYSRVAQGTARRIRRR